MREEISRLAAMAPAPTRSNATDNIINKEDATMAQANNNATTNNANVKETKMNNEIRTSEMSASEFAVKFQEMGYDGCIPTIKGVPHPELMFGYHGEEDGKAAMELLSQALAATNGDIYKAMSYMASAVKTSAVDIEADDHVIIDGEDFVIDYGKRKISKDGIEIANLDSITCPLPNEAIKPMLEDKVRIMMDHRSHYDEF